MSERRPTRTNLAERPAPAPGELTARIDRLITAAHGLAATIAETERIAGRSADLARSRGLVPPARPAGTPDGRLVPLSEVARLTGRHPDLLRRWCLEGRLEAVRVGRTWCLPERTIGQLGRFQRRHRELVGSTAPSTRADEGG